MTPSEFEKRATLTHAQYVELLTLVSKQLENTEKTAAILREVIEIVVKKGPPHG